MGLLGGNPAVPTNGRNARSGMFERVTVHGNKGRGCRSCISILDFLNANLLCEGLRFLIPKNSAEGDPAGKSAVSGVQK